MISLRNHQQKALEMFGEKSQLLAHEMGTGKTITAIAIFKDRGALIVCPSKLRESWVTELGKMNETDIQVIKKGTDTVENKKWLITSYKLAEKIQDQIDFYNTMVMDESHYIKARVRKVKKTAKDGTVTRVNSPVQTVTCVSIATKMLRNEGQTILLSGTPIMNRPSELWNQLLSVGAPITREMTRTQYSEEYCGGCLVPMKGRFIWMEKGATNIQELKEKIADSVDIVKKKEVTDLPDKQIIMTNLEMTPTEKKEYASVWREYLQWIEANPEYSDKDVNNIKSAQQLVELGKLRQVTSKAKVQHFLKNVVEELGAQQAIVFVEYVASLNQLNAGLKTFEDLTFTTLNDANSIEDFQSGKAQILTANIVAGGQGLNLQNASMVFILDRHWTPAQNRQAEDRVHRMGQEEQCTIYYYTVSGTVDERVNTVNEEKEQVIDQLF